MSKISVLILLVACAVGAWAEVHRPQHIVIHQVRRGVAGPNPYILLTAPKGRAQTVLEGFEVMEENEDETASENADETADGNGESSTNQKVDVDIEDEVRSDVDEKDPQQFDEEDEEIKDLLGDPVAAPADDNANDNAMTWHSRLRKPTAQMMGSRIPAGAIMVPDQVIEIEGQSVIDEKTGKAALLLPRSVLESIPDGSVVALMEHLVDEQADERANRVIVRRRRKGARRSVKRRHGSDKRYFILTRAGNKPFSSYRRLNNPAVRRRNHPGGKKQYANRHRVYAF